MPYASSIQIVNDTNGAAYAFLANNGQIWQCQWNAQAQQWDQAEAVPGAQGGEKLQALYLNQLWPSSAAGAPGSAGGVLLAYKVGRGSGSEIMASFGQWNSQGELIWSEPLPLTNDAVEEQAFALVGGKEGDFALVTQKQADGPGIEELLARFSSTAEGQLQSELDAAAIQERPDSDLYLNRFQLQQPSSGSGWNLVNVSEPQTQATVGPVVLAPLPPLVAPAPLAVGGNTELSRKALLMAPVTTSGSQSNRQGGTTSMLGATSDSSEESSSSTSSGVSYKGGAAGQYNTKNGGAMRFGALAFQDPLRWRVAIPKYKYDGENPLLEGVPSDGPPFDNTYDSNERRNTLGSIGKGSQSLIDLVNDDSDNVSNLSFRTADDGDEGSLGVWTITRPDTTQGSVEIQAVWNGVFGLGNFGSGGPTSFSSARIGLEASTDADSKLGTRPGDMPKLSSSWKIGGGVNLGGSLLTTYQYDRGGDTGATSLVGLDSAESVSIGVEFKFIKRTSEGGLIQIDLVGAPGYAFNQTASAQNESFLPDWLGIVGFAGGYIGDIEKKLGSGVFARKIASSRYTYNGLWAWMGNDDLFTLNNKQSIVDGQLTAAETSAGTGGVFSFFNAAIGTLMAAIGPVTARVVNNNSGSLNGAKFSNSTGFELFTRATARYLYKSLIGLQANVVDDYERFYTGAEKGTWEDRFFGNVGVALPFGASVPLLSYLHSWSGEAGEGNGSGGHTPAGAVQGAGSSGAGSASSTAGVNSTSNGFYRVTPTGADYGFAYTPAVASSSYVAPAYVAPAVAGSGSASTQANPYLVGGASADLTQFAITTYSGAVGITLGSEPLVLVNSGLKLIPSAANTPYNVPLLGLTIDGTFKTQAMVSFTVPSTGSYANQIDPSSLQITQAGTYINLPETNPGSNNYILIPDVYGANIVSDVPPSGIPADASNVYADQPVIVLYSTQTGAPLSTQDLQRLVSVDAASLAASGVSYPRYSSQTNSTSAVASNANAPYTYTDVAVVLQGVDSNASLTNLNSQVLNPSSLTATVHLSAGKIIGVDLPQAVLLPLLSGYSQYNLQLQLQLPVQTSIQSQPGSTAADWQPTINNVSLQSTTYNNFVTDEEFSAQAGLNDAGVANAGVYLSAGVNDQLPLYASMGKLPLQNRVSYATTTSSGQQSVQYLNMVRRTENTNNKTISYEPTTIAASTWTPGYIYNKDNHGLFFTLASTPVAATIRGDKASQLSNNYAGETLVAWVEASDEVIPIQAGGNGASNYQNFMASVYGHQRINYRISNGGGWYSPTIAELYAPNGTKASPNSTPPVIIRHLKAYNVAQPGQIDAASGIYKPGEIGTLLVWSESSVDVIKANADEFASGGGDGSPATVIKTAWINPQPNSYQWDDLTRDTSGNSTIKTIPWDPSTDVGLTINDLTLGSMPVVQTAGVSEAPLLSWSQNVRTPYRQSVLDDQPLLYLQLGELQSGLNTVNLGTIQDGGTTATVASATGLNFAIAGALPKASAAAVQNIDGTGVLSTGLGTDYTSISSVINNIPESELSSGNSSIASFTGSIAADVLTVSAISAGVLKVGDVISGVGIPAGIRIKSQITVNASGLGTFQLESVNGAPFLQNVAASTMEAIPAIANAGVMALFTGALSGNTLTVSGVAQGALQLGDVLVGEGVPAGTTITGLAAGTTGDAGTYTLSTSASTPIAASSLVAIPGQPSAPYTLEFWIQMPEASSSNPAPNPNGAGLVAFGQPSTAAVGAAELPQDWLLSSSFVVDQITYKQAAAQGDSTAIAAIANGTSSAAVYGWAWGLVATGAETSATGGTGGGSNLYSNALQITNLQSGALAPGMAHFLSNYALSSADLSGIDGEAANVMALVPTTQLQFDHSLNGSNQPVSILNGIAVDTSTAMLNRGLMTVAQVNASAKSQQLNAMFEALWNFQQKTGEAKVNLLLPQDSSQITTVSPGALPSTITGELYQGYGLDFELLNGPAVSVNGTGQLVFDVGRRISISSPSTTSYNDGQWHYVVASYLPAYQAYSADGVITQLPTNVGTATLLIDNQQVATANNIINAYAPLNLNDQALLLANNAGGAIDQFAFYDKALSISAAASNTTSGNWPQPTSEQALALLAEMGYGIATKTPDPGEIPGAVTMHWAARTVNPNDAELGTFYSTLTSDGWTNASNLNPVQAPQATRPSASRSGSLQQDLAIVVEEKSWTAANWTVNSGSTPAAFLPAGISGVSLRQLKGIQVTLTDSADSTVTSTFTLSPDQVLLGETSVQSRQPLASISNYQFAVPTNTPEFTLLIDKKQLPLPSSKYKSAVPVNYTASYTFTFTDSTSGSSTADGTQKTLTVAPLDSVSINSDGALAYAAASSNGFSAQQLKTVQGYGSAIATAAVIEQAPLQLKYIDSGEVLKSAQTAATANSPSTNQPADSFGESQAFGWFGLSGATQSGWLAIGQPSSRNASSDPAGRVWINYTGQFTITTKADGSTVHQAVTAEAQAPITWLNALAASNFSPDAPNLPLLNSAFNQSSSGGLLIQADPAAGWGQNLGQSMLVADVNDDGVLDLVLASPQANGGGLVYIIDGTWIENNLTTANGSTILNLANPEALGSYVTVLAPSVVNSNTDDVAVSGFGSSLAFDSISKSLLVGAPNYLRQFPTDNTSASTLQGLQPIGAVYSYNASSTNSAWGAGKRTLLTTPLLGSGGQITTLGPDNQPVTTFWGAQLGTALAVDGKGAFAVSAPGVPMALEYSGTKGVQESAVSGKKNPSASFGDGALIKVALPELTSGKLTNVGLPDLISHNQYSVSSVEGTKNPLLIDILQQTYSEGKKGKHKTTPNAQPESAYMQALRALTTDNIAPATLQYNQALQAASVGAVYLIPNSTDLSGLASAATASGLNAAAVAAKSGATFYGAMPWNTLGESRFGSSLAFGDLNNSNNTGGVLAIGASQSGGPGTVYLFDNSQSFGTPSSTPWLNAINLSSNNEYLAHLANGLTLVGENSADSFGNGLRNLGDANADGYSDLAISAFNAASGAGNGYVLFGADQLFQYSKDSNGNLINNPAVGTVASGNVGRFTRADGSIFQASILSQQGSGASALTGQGSYGIGDVNADGYADIALGSGNSGSSYLTWGHGYLEAIHNLQLSKLNSNSGYMLDGLATATQGSLRAIGDFNGDGYGDFISIMPGNALDTVRIELGANTQEILADYPYNYYSFTVATGTEVIAAGDVNGDGLADLALFLNQNLNSAADGNQGAGSTTGLLYGRSSSALPIGSGFGLQARVEPGSSAPLAPLPGLQVGGLTTAPPAFITVGSTIYAVVQGWGDDDSSLWFNQSLDGGNSWAGWSDLSNINPGFAAAAGATQLGTGASLSFYNGKLVLAFVNMAGNLSLASWDPNSGSAGGSWSAPVVLTQFSSISSNACPQLINRGDALALVWIDQDGTLQASSSTSLEQGWGPAQTLQQRSSSDSGAITYTPIAATAAPTLTYLGAESVLAVNEGGSIKVYAGLTGGLSWQLASTFSASSTQPAIGSSSAPVLVATDTGVALTYTDSSGAVNLQRLDLVSLAGAARKGVRLNSNGSFLIDPDTDLLWQSTVLNSSNAGLSTSLPTVPLSVEGTLLLANVRNSASQSNQIWLNAVPAASDPESTTWLNSTVQLADSSGGWSISQEKVLTSALAASWSDASGQSPVAPVFAQDPATGVIFAAVQGTNAQIYWNYSIDGGSSWIGWMAGPGYTDAAPALTVLETSTGSFLVLAYLNNSNIYVSNLFIIDGNNAWSAPYQITDLAAETISLVTEANEVALYYQGINDPNVSVNEIYRAYTSTPDTNSWSANATPLQYVPNDNSVFQTSSGQLVATVLDGTTYLAYQGGTDGIGQSNTIYLTSSSTQINSASWGLISNLPQPLSPAHSGVGLTSLSGSLVLSYADQLAGNPVVSLQQGVVSNGNWSGGTYALLESVGGTSTPQSSLLAPSGSAQVLVGSINTTSAYTSNEILTTLTAPQSSANTSTLSAVGDLNSDGYSDLLVTAIGVSANTANGNQSYTGLRVITGAATSAALVNNNKSTSTSQTVQLAGAFSSGSQVPVTAISGNDLTSGSIDLTIAANNGSKVSTLNATGLPATSLTTPVTSVSGASQLLSGFSSTTTNLAQSSGWGNPSASTAGGYGDLNGDGQLDYLAPGGLDQLYTPDSTLDWNIWSIQAAGDVNGNGVDDVLLSLIPNGPSYTPLSNGQPSAVQAVLLDGSLFRVVNNQFSFAPPPAGSTPGTATTAGLRQPLNPFNQAEITDTTSSSQSQYVGLLQNWIVPINTFQAGTTTSLTINQSSKTNPAGALSDSPPAAVVDAQGNATLIFTGTTPNKSPTTNNTIWCATHDKASGTWTQFATSITNAYTTSPSAAVYDGRLYVAYLDSKNNVWIGSCDASSPVTSSTSWTTYQVMANSAAVQTNFGAPALIGEAGRLAMYFPSYTGTFNSTSAFSGYTTYNVNYLYSSNPYLSSGTSAWGSAMSAGQFSGAAGALQFNYQGTSTDFVAGSQIAAVTFQGKTVLAFAGQGGGAGADWVIRVATAPSAQFEPGAAFEYFSTTQSNLDSPAGVGIGLTTDQASLFMAATASRGEIVDENTGKTNYSTNTDLVTLRPKPSDEGQYVGYAQSQTTSTVFQSNGVPPLNAWLSPAMYMQDGTVMLAGNTYGYNTIDVAAVDAVFAQAAQQSLSGFSIGGNIDNNGDGFTDMLISDPSDPALDLDNQYVLFGGDYLDIASQVGTGGDDTLIGTPLADVIYSLQGADQVISNGGADVIYTGSGNDQIAISDVGFLRIDAGSGFDQLQLQGQAYLDWDFQVSGQRTTTTIYAGTQLKNIELISSVDYGSNTLSFDESAVNRINPDRVLFLALDPSDNAILSGFQRNKAFDTSYLGQLWLAYATGDKALPADSNPALVYVRNADTVTPQELVTAGRNQSSPVVSAPLIPVSNPIASVVSFGDSFQLVGYKASPAQSFVRYAIRRPAEQATARAVLTYASNSTGSANLELGPDASGVAGCIVMDAGVTETFIHVPIEVQAAANRRGGELALIVSQIADVGQIENHIVVRPALDTASQQATRPGLSEFTLTLGSNSTDALLSFKADVNLERNDAKALALTVATRLTADSMVMTTSRSLVLLDSLAQNKSTSSAAYNANSDGYLLDHDADSNAQVNVSIGLNFMKDNGLPDVVLTGPDPQWSTAFTLQNGTELVFSSDVDLTVRRADTTTGKVSFGLQSVSGTAALTLLRDAVAGSSGSINAQDMSRYASANGWLASEGKAIGGVNTANNLVLTGGTWTPMASKDGKALALQSLTQQGNQFTANFADGITGVYATPSVSGTLSSAPIRPAVEVYRLGSYVNTFGFYQLQDSITGTVNGLSPSDPGYLSTALAASKASGLFLDQSRLPGFGGKAIIHDLPLDTKQSYGVIFCVNGDSSTLFSSFAQANLDGATQMISLSNSSDAFTLGIEDQYMSKSSDNDYNDILVKVSGVMVPIFG